MCCETFVVVSVLWSKKHVADSVRANSSSGPGSEVDPELGPHRTMKNRREMSLGGAL